MRSKLIIGTGLTLGLSFLFYTTSGRAPLERSGRGPASVEEKKILTVSGTGIASVKKTETYHFLRQVNVELANGKAKQKFLNLKFNGKVWVTELAPKDGSTLLSLQYELKSEKEEPVHASHLPFLVELGPDYQVKQILSVTAQGKDEHDELNVLKDFISLYAYGSDTDTTGKYSFELNKDGDHFVKKKLSYQSPGARQIQVISALAKGVVDTRSRSPLRIEGNEKTKLISGENSGLSTQTSFLLERVSPESPTKVVNASRDLELKELSIQAENETALKVLPWDFLVSQLKKIGSLSRGARLNLFHEFTKALRAEPAKLASFKQLIEGVAGESGRLSFGVGVLATAGSDSAQGALREWYGRFPSSNHTILNALATTDVPLNPETRKFLIEKADSAQGAEVSQNAAYALGSALKKSGDDEARFALLHLYQNAKSNSERLNALDAIGNSGDEHFIAALENSLQSDSEMEREKAAFAFRFMKSEVASLYLWKAYQDPAPGVKEASIRAIQFQDNLAPYASLLHECASHGNSACQQLLNR